MSVKYRKVWLVIGGTVLWMSFVFHAAYPTVGGGRSATPDADSAWRSAKFVGYSIATRVRIALGWHYNISVLPTVKVSGSVVTLTGLAASIAQRDFMTELVKDVEGVTAVKNDMTIADSN
jgi:hypothetical protein